MTTSILFDENMPPALAKCLPGDLDVVVTTVQYQKWRGKVNGELLRLAAAAGIPVVITMDKSMLGQQNEGSLPLPVIVLAPSLDPRKGETFESLMSNQVADLLRQDLDSRFHIVGSGPTPLDRIKHRSRQGQSSDVEQ